MNRRVEIIIVVCLIILGAFIRFIHFSNSHNMFSVESEAYSKLQLMLQWDQSPLLYPDINFGPLHMPLLKWPWKITGSLVEANRIVSLIMGILLLPLAYLLARKLFSIGSAMATLAFLALAMLPVKTATVTLAEGPTVFFMITGVYLLTLYAEKSEDRWGAFIGAAFALSAMSAMRFETWLFLPIFSLWLFIRKGLFRSALFTSWLAIFPLAHLYICNEKVGDPFNFLNVSASITAINSAKVDVIKRAWGFIDSLVYTNSAPVLVLMIGGIGLIFFTHNPDHMWQQIKKASLRTGKSLLGKVPYTLINGIHSVLNKNKGVLVGLMLIAILGVYEYKAVKATLAPELYRYLTIPGALAALIWPLPIIETGRWILKRESPVVFVIAIGAGLMFGMISYKNLIREEGLMYPTKEVYRMLEEFRPTLNNEDRIFIGSEYHPVIVVESGLVWQNFRHPVYHDNIHASLKSVKTIFEEYKPTLILVFARDPLFYTVMNLDPPCADAHEIFEENYCKEGQVQNWCWYRTCPVLEE